jgi:hypothetical protein
MRQMPVSFVTLDSRDAGGTRAATSGSTRVAVCATLWAGGHPMKNVEMSVSGNILTITVDLSKEFGPSSSGKTLIIASTEGNIAVPDREEKVGLNVYRKK